jgi:16S rRNA G966 N2-methylase RsmD
MEYWKEINNKLKPWIDTDLNKTVVDLFAGCGGLALGLELAGFNTVGLVEQDKNCANTLKINRPNWNIVNTDIKEFNDNYARLARYNIENYIFDPVNLIFAIKDRLLQDTNEQNLKLKAKYVFLRLNPLIRKIIKYVIILYYHQIN